MNEVNKDELALDHCFWREISTNRHFFNLFVGRSKFADGWIDLDRTEKWHQRWFRDPETKLDSETDITLFLIDTREHRKYAIHIENKPAHGKWQPNQPENYKKRAENRMGKWKHDDYQTALIAPQSFIDAHPEAVALFGFVVSYEEISPFVPEFG